MSNAVYTVSVAVKLRLSIKRAKSRESRETENDLKGEKNEETEVRGPRNVRKEATQGVGSVCRSSQNPRVPGQ